MATNTTYYAGGYIAAATAKNRAAEADSGSGTFTTWSASGAQTGQRALTSQEAADLAAQDATTVAATNAVTVQSRAQAALTANATFLALATPTNAQVVAQVQRLTKECNALIRLALSATADITDTA